MGYFFAFLITAALSAAITPLIIKIARQFKILDFPDDQRKMHTEVKPLLGGLAPFLAFFSIIGFLCWFQPEFLLAKIPVRHLIGLAIGAGFLMIGGILDDKFRLRPSFQIVFPTLSALTIIGSGIGVKEITNPFGGVISFADWQADIFTFVWLMGVMYTTKLLDGLDGLVSGLTVIGSGIILFLATTTQWYQPEIGLMSAIASGAFAGFLLWNFFPAKIFLGEGGSTFAGFLLGVLAIISGGKIATTLLVLGIPILDFGWVILRRLFWEKKSFVHDDKKHLHFRLLEAGFSHRNAVLVLYLAAALFGVTTLVLQSREKLVALGILFVFMVSLGAATILKSKKSRF